MSKKILSVGLMLLAASTAFGQQSQQVERSETLQKSSRQTSQGQPNQGIDQAIASCLQLANFEEVEIVKFAQQHLSNPDVKAFADHLAKDHGKLLTDLGEVYPQGRDQAAKGTQDRANLTPSSKAQGKIVSQDTDSQRTEQSSVTRNEQASAVEDVNLESGNRMAQVQEMQKAVTEACLRLTKEELERHQGADFDMAFVGMQVGCHIGMLAKLEAGSKMASPELQETLTNATQMTRKHLEMARELCSKLGKSDERKADRDDSADATRR